MEIYNQAKILLGEDKNLDKYKSLFTQDFKKNTYKNLDEQNKKIQYKPIFSKSIYRDLISYLKNKYQSQFSCNVYIFDSDKKSKEKFKNAINAYAKLSAGEKPIICYDITFFGSADEGFIITTKGIWLNNNLVKSKFFDWKKNPVIELNNNEIFIDGIFLEHSSPKKEIPILFEMIKEIREKMIQYI